MPPVSIGRVGYRIDVPPSSQPVFVFLDAGGRANDTRIWGGLAVFGVDELGWISAVVAELASRPNAVLQPDGEIKGRDVPLEVAQSIGRRIRDEDRRIVFWGARHRSPDTPIWESAQTEFREFLASLQSDPTRLDREHVNRRFLAYSRYVQNLKPVNQHKLIAIVSHLQWLFEGLKATRTGSRLAEATVVIDQENFPEPIAECASLVKALICSGLQASGMHYRLTGTALKEAAQDGAVRVDVTGDSRKTPGLQLVDVLLQVVRLQLPGG